MDVFSINDRVRAMLALLKAERGANIQAILETRFLCMMQHAVEDFLRPFEVAVGSETDTDFCFLRSMRLHQRQNLFSDAPPALIRGVKQVMSFLAADLTEKLCVTLSDEHVVLGFVKL